MNINDILLAVGVLIGILSKGYALRDTRTTWSRKSSGINILFYPVTALLPFYREGLYVTFTTTFATFVVWIGIFIWRSPEGEDWLGRVDQTYSEWFKKSF